MALKPVNKLLHDDLTALKAALGPLDPAAVFIGLFTAIAGPADRNRVLADLTEATFTGYARQAIGAWTDPYNSGTGLILMDADNKHFTPTDAVTPNTVIGWFLATAAVGGALLAIEMFAAGVPLPDADTTLTIGPRIGFDPVANYGSATVVS